MQRRKGTWKCGQELKSSQKPSCQSTEPRRYTFGCTLRVCWLCSLEFCSEMVVVVYSSPALSDPMNCSKPGFPVLLYLLEFAQTHVHWIADTIQPSSFVALFSFAFNLSAGWTKRPLDELSYKFPTLSWFPICFFCSELGYIKTFTINHVTY